MKRSVRIGLVLVMTLGWFTPVAQAGAGGGCHSGVLTDERTSEVKTAGGCFLPTVARVKAGDTVTFFNGEDMEHNVTGVPEPFNAMTKRAGTGMLTTNTTLPFRFAEPGVYPYVCTLHPMMAGAIVVGDGVAGDGAAALGTSDDSATAGEQAASAAASSESVRSWWPGAALVGAIAFAALIAAKLQRAIRRRRAPEPGLS